MTLDEARRCLGVSANATADDIRSAFRHKARMVHPDMNPGATPQDLARLSLEFDRAREARDILVRYTLDPLRKPPPTASYSQPFAAPAWAPFPRGTTPRTARPSPQASTPPRPGPRPRPATRAQRPPRVAMRFDEFVAWTDAAGFGTGARSPRYIDVSRIVVWSALGLGVAGLAAAIVFTALV